MSPSLLLSLSSKPSLRKFALRSSHRLGIRMFSSSSSSSTTTTTTNPYMMYGVSSGGELSPQTGTMTGLFMFDPTKEENFFVGDKPFPKELVESRLVGSSHGWGVFLTHPSSIILSDFCNPSSSKSNPKFIPLQPRENVRGSQTELLSGLAMSSSPEEEDCVTAVKYAGRMVTIDTPGRESKGNRIIMSDQIFDYCENSMLMYSKRDKMFYVPSSGGHHLWSWDGLPSTKPHFHELRFHNIPLFSNSELLLLDSCYKTHHLVESPSGQRFLIKWYAQSVATKSIKYTCEGTMRFMVFREEEDMNMVYTQDIGDLCIFIGKDNEPFCLKASSFPGLSPNSIYFVGQGLGRGVYDIATRTPRSFIVKSPSPFLDLPPILLELIHFWAPHWVPPFSI